MNILPFALPKFKVEIPAPKTVITLDTPSKGDFYALLCGGDAAEILRRYTDAPMTPVIARIAAQRYIEQVRRYREDNMDIMEIPHTTDFGAVPKEDKLPCLTLAEHMVYRYSGIDFTAQLELPVTDYWILLADAAKREIMKRSDRDEYIEECYNDMHRISTIK